jgi:predicted ATP-dependent serine protease
LREVLSRIITLGEVTLAGIVREVNAALKRKEEARIYHWHRRTGHYPPRRNVTSDVVPGHPPDP